MLKNILFILCLFFIDINAQTHIAQTHTVRYGTSHRKVLATTEGVVWEKLPMDYVENKIINFIQEHNINNCFEHQESPHRLLLKCWAFNEVFDVSINVNKHHKKPMTMYI